MNSFDRAVSPPSLSRGLAILRLLASHAGPITAFSISRDLEIPRSSVYVVLRALEEDGFVVHIDNGHLWGLGPAAFEVGSAYLRSGPLERLAQPKLARLATFTGSTAHLSVLHGADTLYLAKVQSPRMPLLITDVGVRIPAFLTATGKAMLSYLSKSQVGALYSSDENFTTRTGRGSHSLSELIGVLDTVLKRGWAVEDGEVSPNLASIASPILDHNGMPVAAIGVTMVHSCPQVTDSYPCGMDFGEFATVVRSAALSVTIAIHGRLS